MRFVAFGALLSICIGSSAVAQTVPPAAEKLYYCSQVMVAMAAEEANPSRKAEYDNDSRRLQSLGHNVLIREGWSESSALVVSGYYGDEVGEAFFGDGKLRYSVSDCKAALTEAR